MLQKTHQSELETLEQKFKAEIEELESQRKAQELLAKEKIVEVQKEIVEVEVVREPEKPETSDQETQTEAVQI